MQRINGSLCATALILLMGGLGGGRRPLRQRAIRIGRIHAGKSRSLPLRRHQGRSHGLYDGDRQPASRERHRHGV